MEDFEIIKELGQGSFAVVYKVKRKIDSTIYAMKQVKFNEMGKSDREHAINEIRMLASFTHGNIISYKESFYSEQDKILSIVMEYANCGDLLYLIKQAKQARLPLQEELIWRYLIQILFGLKALHDKNFIHRDIKSANIFLDANNVIKIGDFNVSKRWKNSQFLQSQTGTPYYSSPEIWLEKPYDYRTDIWSAGCVIYELCALSVPFKAQTLEGLKREICRGKYKKIPELYSSNWSNLIALMLNTDMNSRVTCEELLKVDYVQEKIKEWKMEYVPSQESVLNTIKLPKKVEDLGGMLPQKKYSSDVKLIQIKKEDVNEKEGDQEKVRCLSSWGNNGKYKWIKRGLNNQQANENEKGLINIIPVSLKNINLFPKVPGTDIKNIYDNWVNHKVNKEINVPIIHREWSVNKVNIKPEDPPGNNIKIMKIAPKLMPKYSNKPVKVYWNWNDLLVDEAWCKI